MTLESRLKKTAEALAVLKKYGPMTTVRLGQLLWSGDSVAHPRAAGTVLAALERRGLVTWRYVGG